MFFNFYLFIRPESREVVSPLIIVFKIDFDPKAPALTEQEITTGNFHNRTIHNNLILM